jgi:hypothetical protein
MGSNTCKQLAAIAALSASLFMMGGTAFASTTGTTAQGAGYTTGLVPGPVGNASESARSTAADVRNEIHQHQW